MERLDSLTVCMEVLQGEAVGGRDHLDKRDW